MKTNTLTKQTKLATYLTLTAGAGFAATSADGATVVTFYGVNSANDTNPNPTGIRVGRVGGNARFAVDADSSSATAFGYANGAGYFSRGADRVIGIGRAAGNYRQIFSDQFGYGAIGGDQNYVNVSFNGNDGVYESVAQFNFSATPGAGYLVAIARNDDNTALSISNGKTAIDAVPEPSALALLALGSAGLLARRNRKLAA